MPAHQELASTTARTIRARTGIETLDGVGVALVGDLAIVSWTSAATLERVRWAFDQAEKVRARNPDGALVLQIIARSSSPPDAVTLKLARERFAEIGPALRRMVTVPLGDEFWTAIVRAITRGVFLFSGHSKRHFVSTREAALDLLLEGATASTPTRAELEQLIAELQRRVRGPRWA